MNGIVTPPEVQRSDLSEVRRALRSLLPPGQVTELRILDAVTSADRWPHTAIGYFNDHEKLVESVDSVRSATSIYIIPNPVDPDLLARAYNRIRRAGKGESTSDANITARRYLLVDADPIKPSGISSTDAQHQAALDRIQTVRDTLHYNYGFPEPITADSGNGGHLVYLVDLPVDDGGLIQQCLAALALQFTDDAVKIDTGVFNPSRIWKLYGTVACKGDSTPDRPHRLSRILSIPDVLVPVDKALLQELACESPHSAPPATNSAPTHPVSDTAVFDIDKFLSEQTFEVDGPFPYNGGRKWTFRTSPLCDHHDDGPFLIQRENGALAAGCHHESCKWNWHDLRARFAPKADSSLYERLVHNVTGGNGDGAAPLEATVTPPPVESPKVEYVWITSSELESGNYDVEYAIAGTLVEQQPLIIAGPMKSLKTSIMLDAAISLSRRGLFLGRLKVNRPHRVAVMSGESGLATLQDTAKRICRAANTSLGECENLIWSANLPTFGSTPHLEALERDLRTSDIDVLFVDPAYMSLPTADHGNLMVQGALLRSVSDVCQELGVTLVLAHHTKRHIGHDPYEPMELADIAWAGFAEFARQWWLVNRRTRYEEGTGYHELWLSIGGSAGHSSLWAVNVAEGLPTDPGGRKWEVDLASTTEAREAAAERQQQAKKEEAEKRLEVDRKTICDALAKLPDRTGTKTDIKDTSGLNEARFRPAFASLLQDKSLLPSTVTKSNNQTYDAYTFADNDN